VKSLTFPDPDLNVTETYHLKMGEIGLIKTFIHFDHYHNEINNPIGNDWTNVTVDEFDQFRVNLDYTRCFGTLSNLPPIDISSFNPTAPSATPASSIPPNTASSPAPMFTLAEAKPALTHVLENVIANEIVTRALNDEGVDNIISLVKLTDDVVYNLAYLDPDSKIWIKLKMGLIHFIKSSIHYVRFHEETNPIGNDWKSITMEDYDNFRANLNYTRRFASLSSLPPFDMTYVNDEPNLLDAPDVLDETDVLNVTDVADVDDASKALDVVNVLDGSDIFSVTNVPDVTDVPDDDDASCSIDVSDVLDESEICTVTDDLDITVVETTKIVVVDVPDALNVTDITDHQ
jgi:hypothetical protein